MLDGASIRLCAVLLSDLLQFFSSLLLLCAAVEEVSERLKRQHKGGELGDKAESVATWLVQEASVNVWYHPQTHQIFGVSLLGRMP